jgi:hypothetical protein
MEGSIAPASLFAVRVDASIAAVDSAKEALTATAIDSGLTSRVDRRFRYRLDETRERLIALGAQGAAVESPSPEMWEALKGLDDEARGAFRESLAFIEGALVRSARVDRGVCEVADALLYTLARGAEVSWARLTILAEDEFLDQFADIVRLRYPDFSVWSLPVAAHEFGHVVGRKLSYTGPGGDEVFPIRQLLDAGDVTPEHFSELFSDFFATYTLGPAYACTCLLLRAAPIGVADDPAESHPSWRRRAELILSTLKTLEADANDYMLSQVRRAWRAVIGAEQGSLDDNTRGQVAWLRRGFMSVLNTHASDLRYTESVQVVALATWLTQPDAPQVPDFAFSIQEVLNAAWRCRLEQWDQWGAIRGDVEPRALEACLVAARRLADEVAA